MNIAEFAIRKKTVMMVLVILIFGAGLITYGKLGRLEDPEYTIKEALIITPYPGATAKEVEEEVNDRIEMAIQQLGQLKHVTSMAQPGLSIITAEIKDKYDKNTLPQVWDELRRKVGDMQPTLPPGAGPSVVNDDYGDVYGILFAITGKGYTYRELEDYADFLRKELLLVHDVAKVDIWGVQPQEVHVEIARSKMAQLGISLEEVYTTLAKQNLVNPSGAVKVGTEYIYIRPTGDFKTVKEIGNLVVRAREKGKTIFLKDIATVKRGYKTPPNTLIRFNGENALAIGLSVVPGGNVVKVGEDIKTRLNKLKALSPVGIQIKIISFQPDSVSQSISSFVISLAEALAIVIGVLLIFMGLRSGLLIGLVLLLTIFGTFIFMNLWGINLERISLGALIIALGMLVDNAIVINDGMLVRIEGGGDPLKAARDVVGQSAVPLLGATVIAVLAFAAIGLSQNSTGEYTRSLFQVILISLMLSWFIAVTITPLFCAMLLKPKGASGKPPTDPYQGSFFLLYKRLLNFCIHFRWGTMVLLVGLLCVAIYGFTLLEGSFFPDSTRTQFMVHYWLPQGTDIRRTSADIKVLEAHIKGLKGVDSVASFVGQGAPRLVLTYGPEKAYTSYGILMVAVKNFKDIGRLMSETQDYADTHFVNAQVKIRRFVLGPSAQDTLEARFSGPDPMVLRQLANAAKKIMQQDGGVVGIKDDWRERTKVLRPVLAENQAREAGLTKRDVSRALNMNFTGQPVGIYRDEDKILSIISRPPKNEREAVDNINDIQIWSPVAQRTIPLRQVVSNFTTAWEDAVIQRRDRMRTITAQGTQRTGNASVVFARIRPKIEAIKLPPGYRMEWGGEYEDSQDAQAALFINIPVTGLLIVFILIALFNAIRQPLIILLTVPLAIIGVTIGLLVTGQSFGFMALLGFLSLAGMLIKNSIVLIDQIDLEIREGKSTMDAILDSSVSRLRPVTMAAVTTVLGMTPLLFDIFFIGMAVTIMAGLTFATILTLIVVPVLYAIFFKAAYKEKMMPGQVAAQKRG